MEWWTDLWLNEGFATWVGWRAVDNAFPHWRVWDQFLSKTSLLLPPHSGGGRVWGSHQEWGRSGLMTVFLCDSYLI